MKNYKTILLFGLLVWVIIYVSSQIIFKLRSTDLLLFESIFPVIISISVMIFAVLYFRKIYRNEVSEGVKIGIIWLLITLALDYLLYIRGSWEMNFELYFEDFAITYLIIPVVTIGIGYLLDKKTDL
ncbi:MAG: hypothetical protein GF347_00390 [Candidatus Moranbacteria bacterium]|nr:hypothetical protein [Candidatus Moranbacteria bacterium]